MELYKITNDLMRYRGDLIFDGDGDILPDAINNLTAENNFTDKILDLASIYKNMNVEAQVMKEYETSMRERRKVTENKIKSLKGYMFENMKNAEIYKVSGIESSVSFRKTPGRVAIDNAELISSEYYIEQAPTLDRAKLKEDLKDGLVIDGAHLEIGENLSIR